MVHSLQLYSTVRLYFGSSAVEVAGGGYLGSDSREVGDLRYVLLPRLCRVRWFPESHQDPTKGHKIDAGIGIRAYQV